MQFPEYMLRFAMNIWAADGLRGVYQFDLDERIVAVLEEVANLLLMNLDHTEEQLTR